MNKQEVYDFLTARGIEFEWTEHEAVFNMTELDAVELPHPDRDAKNLFVRDDKKRNYYLITVRGPKRVDLKEFRKGHGLRPLSFGSPEDLLSIMKLTPGSVSPLGLLDDEECRVKLFLDKSFSDGLIGIHPNDNTATVWLDAQDLIDIISDHGNEIELVDL